MHFVPLFTSLSHTHRQYMQVTSRKDQEQYWFNSEIPYRYVTVDEFSKKPEMSHLDGKIWLHDKLPSKAEDFQCDKNLPQKDKNKYSMTKWQLFKACMDREILLTKRNLSANIIKSTQVTTLSFPNIYYKSSSGTNL